MLAVFREALSQGQKRRLVPEAHGDRNVYPRMCTTATLAKPARAYRPRLTQAKARSEKPWILTRMT
jgi:hypothetical protein